MSRDGPITELSLTCPSGGNFYICQGNSTQFIGCCTTDPCAGGAGFCPRANLKPATFNKLDYHGIAAQSCTDTKAAWYLCSALSTPFMGCCSSDACTNRSGCPHNDLVAAMLGNATEAQVFLTTTASVTSTSKTMTSSITSTAATTTAAAAVAATETTMPISPETGLSMGAKAGIGVGTVALVALIAVLFLVIRRVVAKRRGVVVRGSEPPSPSSMSDTSTSSYANRKQLTYSTLLPSGAHDPVWPSPAAKSPYSAVSSSSTGFISRETSVRSAASSNVLGIMSGSSAEGQRPQYHQYGSQSGYTSPPLDMLAELDGSDVFPTPAISEMGGPTPTTSRQSMPFRPYRPSR